MRYLHVRILRVLYTSFSKDEFKILCIMLYNISAYTSKLINILSLLLKKS